MPFIVYQTKYVCSIRFNNIRVPRENLLNLVADVLPDGQYVSTINDPDQVSHPPSQPFFLYLTHIEKMERAVNKASQFSNFVLFLLLNKHSFLFAEVCSIFISSHAWPGKYCG